MHPNPAFRKTSENKNLDFVRTRGFGTLAVNGKPTEAPLLSHIPYIVNEDATWVEAHLVRSNPILKLLDQPVPAVVSITGPDSYISPDWYEIDDQVPTWNYVAVHVRGTLIRLPDEELAGILDRLSAHFEQELLPKAPWHRNKMTAGTFERMIRMIVPIKLEILSIDGTWKLSQNKPNEVRINAAEKVAQNGVGSERNALSELMKNPPG